MFSYVNQFGVIFDLDGVIVDTKEAHHQAFAKLGEEVGYVISDEQFRDVFGRHNSDIFPILFSKELPPEEIDRLSDRKEAIFRDIIRGHIAPLPGVGALLPALVEAGFLLAIGTSTPRENVELILNDLGYTRYFTAISSAEDVTSGKPDPQVFLVAAHRLGVPPSRCVVVEDAVSGVQAALNGGMKALAVTTNHPQAALTHAHRVVHSLEEVSPQDMLDLLQSA